MEEEQGKLEQIDKVFRDDPNDDRPLGGGGGNKFSIPEYPDGEAPPDLPPAPKKKVVNSNRLATKNKPTIDKELQQENEKDNSTNDTNQQVEEKLEEGFVKIDKPIRDDPNDDRPLGGAKFQIPEFADGEAPPEDKPKPKAIPKRFQAKTSTVDKADSQTDSASQPAEKKEKKPASSTANKPWLNKQTAVQQEEQVENNDEKPIGGKGTYNLDDEKPIDGKGTYNLNDEKPLGGKGTYNLDDEKPIGGKGTYNLDDEKPIGGGKKTNFMDEDERPVGAGSKNTMMSEYPEGMDPDSVQDSAASK